MFENFVKEVKRLKAKGFATKSEKKALDALFKDLDQDEQEIVEPKADEVNDLPEEAPADADEDKDDEPADPDNGGDEPSDDTQAEIEKGIKALIKGEVSSIKDDIKTWLAEQKDNADKKAGLYNPEVKRDRAKMNSYVRNLFKSLSGDQKAEFKLKEMSTDSSGSPYAGYAVDSELSAEIRHLVTEYGVAAREMNAIQLSKNSYKANNLATDVTVGWTSEGGAINSTQAVLGQQELSLNKLTAIVSFTNELLEDEEIDLVSFIASRVAEGFAEAEDTAFFDGDGTSTYGSFTGLLRNSNVNTVTMGSGDGAFSDIDADDLIDMVDATPQGAHRNGKFYMHRTIMSYVRKLKDSQGMYIYQAPSQGGPATVWGYPVVLVEAMPSKTDTAVSTAFVLFGDLRKACIYGYKGTIRADRFNSGVIRNVADSADVNLITTDREAVRWVKRVGYIAILPTAVTRLRTAASSN